MPSPSTPRIRPSILGKKAALYANQHGIEGQRAQVALVLDISVSMNRTLQVWGGATGQVVKGSGNLGQVRGTWHTHRWYQPGPRCWRQTLFE